MKLCPPCQSRFEKAIRENQSEFSICENCIRLQEFGTGTRWSHSDLRTSAFAMGIGENRKPVIEAHFEVKPKAPKSEPLNAGSAAATREYHDIMKDRIGAFRGAYEYGTRRPHWPLNIRLGDDE